MNRASIETALDEDLRLSVGAMQRAALRAREIARQTATALVISQNGVLELLQPDRISTPVTSEQEHAADHKTS